MSSESGSKNGIMEAMSNEGPHMRDYEQKSEMLWNEAPKKLKHNIQNTVFKKNKSHLTKKKKECNFRAHAYIYLVSLIRPKY